MQVTDYIKKYDLESGRFSTDSVVVDMAIDFITKIELEDKLETPYKQFKQACDELSNKYQHLKKYAPSLNGVQWNLFYAKVYSKIRGFLYEREALSSGTPDYKNAYDNSPEDCDFFLFILDEFTDLKESKYTFDYGCFLKIYPQVTDDEKIILEEYENLVGDETSADDRYELTLAKNQCLYLVERDDFDLNKVREILHGKTVSEIKERQQQRSEPETEKETQVAIPEQKEKEKGDDQQHIVHYTPDPQAAAIKTMLFDNLKNIQAGKMDVNRANSFNSTVQTYINMAKAQLEIEKFVSSKQRRK